MNFLIWRGEGISQKDADVIKEPSLAQLAELGEVSSGLPHHPHGRPLHRLAAGRPQDEVVLQGGKLQFGEKDLFTHFIVDHISRQQVA